MSSGYERDISDFLSGTQGVVYVRNLDKRRMSARSDNRFRVSLGRHSDGSPGVTITSGGGKYVHIDNRHVLRTLGSTLLDAYEDWTRELAESTAPERTVAEADERWEDDGGR